MKLFAWLVTWLSSFYIGTQTSFSIALALIIFVSAYNLVLWIEDEERGRH